MRATLPVLRRSAPPPTILGPNGKPFQRSAPDHPTVLSATYDSAQTTDLNSRHWAATDALSADQANSYDIRKVLRERARYETGNNAYLSGIVDTYASDVVGVGPRLQMIGGDPGLNREIERAWNDWTRATKFGRKLRTVQRARTVDGEGFAVMQTNPRVKNAVKLDLKLIECDRVHTPQIMPAPDNIDGVIIDEYDNAVTYEMLRRHPGALLAFNYEDDVDVIDARYVLHWFAADRPEQHRGVPEIMASLPLCALLRRYTLAVVQSAETAASFTALLYSDAPPNGEAADIEAFDAVEIERNMMTTMPQGWKMGQFKPEQPTDNYPDFKGEIISEAGRPISMPRNIATCDSSKYNFASGRLDHSTYFKRVVTVQIDQSIEIVDPVWEVWWDEACRVNRRWPSHDGRHGWLWQGRDPIDPREARAESERLSSGATTLPQLYSRRGEDWEEEMEKGAAALGIGMQEYQVLLRQKLFGNVPQGEVQPVDASWAEEAVEDALANTK